MLSQSGLKYFDCNFINFIGFAIREIYGNSFNFTHNNFICDYFAKNNKNPIFPDFVIAF